MDPVGQAQPLLVRDVGNRRRERGGDALERVVVVIQHDDVPRRTETRARAPIDPFFGRRGHAPIVVTSSPVSTLTYDVEAVRARYSALRRPLAFFDGPGGTQVPDEVIDAVSRYYRE